MFTGIVEELAVVRAISMGKSSATIAISASMVLADLELGASISVDGVCLTVIEITESGFSADVMHETLVRSTLGDAQPGRRVNLERPMLANGRFGGHIVAGHVDCTTVVVARVPGDRWDVVTVSIPLDLRRYLVPQGSITLDGVSLTISAVDDVAGTASVSLIPTTSANTTLGLRQVGDRLNLEVDLLGKYVARMVTAGQELSA